MRRVTLTRHAEIRLIERARLPRGARSEIRRRLAAALKAGVRPGRDLGVEIRLSDGCRAICYPGAQGGWIVATILPAREREKEAAG